jgi:FkbM family methyltransferase
VRSSGRPGHLLDRAYGLGRSLWMYYGTWGQGARMRAFYAPFVRPGTLCFDIGAHVGSRSRCWSGLGARVLAVEPQPDFARFLRLLFWRDPKVSVLPQAVAARAGTVTLHVSPRTPTVSTGSRSFIEETSRVPGFAWVDWSQQLTVPATTLDALILRHGEPAFVKIDVEGMEHEVLAGLSRPLPALSFEFVPASPSSARASLERLAALGDYVWNVALGEEPAFLFDRPVAPAAMLSWLAARDPEGPSGDLYAIRAA